jgi:predicted transposase YbfD/YdcC
MMTSFDVYKEYLALKNHFTSQSYDYFRYQGKLKVNASSFNQRKDKLFFQKLSKHPDVHNFLLANLSRNEKSWIKELAYSEDAERIYKDWLKRNQSLTYVIKNDLRQLITPFDSNLIVSKVEPHPRLLRLYLGGYVTLETMCILLDITKAKKHWDSKMEYDPVYEEVKKKIEKYTPFIKYDKEKFKKILIDFFGE